MITRKAFQPGEWVATFTGQAGRVLDPEQLSRIRSQCREGNKPGRYFAPGCCQNPDYVVQVPVLFEDGTYDIMRALNLKRAPELSAERKAAVERYL